jgi:hypothetical protein
VCDIVRSGDRDDAMLVTSAGRDALRSSDPTVIRSVLECPPGSHRQSIAVLTLTQVRRMCGARIESNRSACAAREECEEQVRTSAAAQWDCERSPPPIRTLTLAQCAHTMRASMMMTMLCFSLSMVVFEKVR